MAAQAETPTLAKCQARITLWADTAGESKTEITEFLDELVLWNHVVRLTRSFNAGAYIL